MNPEKPRTTTLKPSDAVHSVRSDDLDLYVTPSEDNSIQQAPKQLTNRVDNIETLTRTVLFVVSATLVATVVAVIGLVVDQFRFNYTAQQETSKFLELKIEELETKLETATQDLNTAHSTLLEANASSENSATE